MTTETITRAYKVRLDPNDAQVKKFYEYAGCARWAYNWALRMFRKFDKYDYYSREFYRPLLAKLGPDATKDDRKKVYTDHKDAARAYAKSKNARFKVRLEELMRNVLGYDDKTISQVLKLGHLDLNYLWVQRRSIDMKWWDDTDVNVEAFRTAFKSAASARTRFFKGLSGPPKFKKRGDSDSFTLLHTAKNPSIRFSDRHPRRVLIPGIARSTTRAVEKKRGYLEGVRVMDRGGAARIRRAVKNGGVIKNITISRNGSRWYGSFLVEESISLNESYTKKQLLGGPLGIDQGVRVESRFAQSDGILIKNPKFYITSQVRRNKLAKAHSAKSEGSKNRRRAATRLADLEHKIALRRKTFLDSYTKNLVESHTTIAIEDLNVEGMLKKVRAVPDPDNPGAYLPNGRASKSGLSKVLSDAAFYEFRRQLEYKMKWYNVSPVLYAGTFAPTSKKCFSCGEVKKKLSLSDRTYVCDKCGWTEDRDVNAALNILKFGLQTV